MAVAAVVVHVLLLAVQETATGTAGALMVATVVAAVVAVAADAVVAGEDAEAATKITYSYLFIIGGSQFFVFIAYPNSPS